MNKLYLARGRYYKRSMRRMCGEWFFYRPLNTDDNHSANLYGDN